MDCVHEAVTRRPLTRRSRHARRCSIFFSLTKFSKSVAKRTLSGLEHWNPKVSVHENGRPFLWICFTPFVCACATQHATKMTSTNPFAAVATILEVPLDDPVPSHLLLKLKRKPERKRKVRFTDDTIDNEDLCRKKSKNCCVFHRSQAPPDDDDDGGDDDTPGDAHPEGSGASPAADSGSSSSSSSSEADSAT